MLDPTTRLSPDRTIDPRPEMLASSTPIDVVLVLTADQFHAEHVIAAANAGKHVLIEKPMAQTEAEADAIEKARVDNGVVVFVGYMRRYATALERLKEAIKGKEIKCGLRWARVAHNASLDEVMGSADCRCAGARYHRRREWAASSLRYSSLRRLFADLQKHCVQSLHRDRNVP